MYKKYLKLLLILSFKNVFTYVVDHRYTYQEPRGKNFGLKNILLLFSYPLIAIKDLVFETIVFHSRKVPSVGDFSYGIKWLMGSLFFVLQIPLLLCLRCTFLSEMGPGEAQWFQTAKTRHKISSLDVISQVFPCKLHGNSHLFPFPGMSFIL